MTHPRKIRRDASILASAIAFVCLLVPRSAPSGDSVDPGAPAADAVARRLIVFNTVHALRFQPTRRERIGGSLLSDLDLQRRRAVTWLKAEGLWDDPVACRPRDRQLLSAPAGSLTSEAAAEIQRLGERISVLLLALGLVDALPPPDGTPPPIRPARGRAAIPEVGEATAPFVHSARLRADDALPTGSETAELWLLRSVLQQKIESGAYPEGADLAALVDDLRAKMAAAGLEMRTVEDGPSVFAELIRYSSFTAGQRGLAAEPIGEDFPVFGKAYRELGAKELELLRRLASERLRAHVWLVSGERGVEDEARREAEAPSPTDETEPDR